MPIIPLQLATRSNPARFTQGGTASLINCYVEDIGDDGKVPWCVVARDGLQGFANVAEANSGIRAAVVVGTGLWFVAGTGLYRASLNGAVEFIGAMSISETAPVYTARNRRSPTDIAICCDGLLYNYRTSLQQVTDPDLLAPTSLTVIDGQFAIGTANNLWQVGDIDDGLNWDGLSFERADASPDAVIRVAARQGELIIFGEVTTEFWRNEGLADGTGYVRSAVIDRGCIAPNSVAMAEQATFFVADDRTVRMLQGYQPVRVSDHALERLIQALPDATVIRGTSWVKDGHNFYMITAPGVWSWIYNTRTGRWHQASTYGRPDWRISIVLPFGDKLIACDAELPRLYEMGAEFLDDAGDPIVTEMILPPAETFPNRATFHAVYVDAEKGVGTGQGAPQDVDPELMLSWSDDGGATFKGNRLLKLGQQGQRRVLLKATRLGQCGPDGRRFKITASAKVAKALYQMKADIQVDAPR